MPIFIFIACLLFSLVYNANAAPLTKQTTTQATGSSEPSQEKQLLQTLSALTNAPMTRIESTKTVESSLIGKKTNYTGEILLSRGKFRWNTFSPEKSTLLFDGKTLWVIQDQFVTRTKLSSNAKSQTLIAILFDPKSLKKKFELKETKNNSEEISFALKAKAKDVTVTNIQIVLDATTKELKKLSYSENDTQTVIEFHKVEKIQKADTKQFVFKPKPGDQVTEM